MILTKEILYGKSCEMLQKTMVVYKISRLSDGKIYIGKTTKKLRERILGHIHNNRNYHFDNAIKKYETEAFDVSVVEECGTPEELNAREIYWIKFFNCKYPDGFNMTDGGEGTLGYVPTDDLRKLWSKIRKGRRPSEQTRSRRSASLKGHPVSKATRDKISARHKGRIISAESRKKMSESHKGKPLKAEHKAHLSASIKNRRRVICLDNGKIFESIAAAAKWANVAACVLSSALSGRVKTAGGHYWAYSDPAADLPIKIRISSRPYRRRKVRCVETGEIFPSLVEAAKFAGVQNTTISAVLHGRTKTAGGYHWQDADE